MQPSCPHCDQPDLSLLRLVLIGELLKADATWLLCLADVMQQCGLLPLAAEAEASEAPVVRTRTATLHTLHPTPPRSRWRTSGGSMRSHLTTLRTSVASL